MVIEKNRITNIEVKKKNRNRIFRYICRNGIVSNPDIAYDLKISLPTVTQNTKELLEQGLIKEAGELQSTGGRRAKALTAASDSRLAAGLDITKNHIGLLLADLTGEIVKYERLHQPYIGDENYYRHISGRLEAFLKETVEVPKKEKLSLKVQLLAVIQNKPYLIAVAGQFLFGLTLYGRNADALYYFTYVEGDQALFSTYSLCIIIPSIIGAACFPPLFKATGNKGRAAAIFALLTGISMFSMYFFSVGSTPVPFYLFSCLAQFFFSGFNTAIYAIIPDCVEYGEWKTGLRNDGFQYAFISLGNKIGMAIGTSVLAAVLGACGYAANQQQNEAVLAVMKHAFTTIPGILWAVTAVVLFFYQLNRKTYSKIVEEIQERKTMMHG